MISVCMPNLNGAPFLEERIRTIRDQTFGDYEVVIVDNHSDDGAYEIFQRYAASDARVRLSQAPREGMYANWNNCLRAARGEWIYIATSDDTMTRDCLEQLHEATTRQPRARVITSLPWVIDAGGRTMTDRRDDLGRLLLGRRRGTSGWTTPRNELLSAMVFGTPTLSITQFLIHASAFQVAGLFPTGYGSTGDFAWQMRAIERLPIYHLGKQLGSWRRHAAQATKADLSALFALRARILMDWHREVRPRLDAGMSVAFGYALALAGTEPGAELPERVRTWCARFRTLLKARSPLAHPALLAPVARGMCWGRPAEAGPAAQPTAV